MAASFLSNPSKSTLHSFQKDLQRGLKESLAQQNLPTSKSQLHKFLDEIEKSQNGGKKKGGLEGLKNNMPGNKGGKRLARIAVTEISTRVSGERQPESREDVEEVEQQEKRGRQSSSDNSREKKRGSLREVDEKTQHHRQHLSASGVTETPPPTPITGPGKSGKRAPFASDRAVVDIVGEDGVTTRRSTRPPTYENVTGWSSEGENEKKVAELNA